MLVHDVYFTLKDDSPAARRRLVDSCYALLKDLPGIAHFAAGERSPDLARPVNDREFHVGLHVAFVDRPAHDAYQAAEQHQRFISENRDDWAQVRVFDTDISAPRG
ncbi:MAG: Dabb family protein [Planctomycetales bacterium]